MSIQHIVYDSASQRLSGAIEKAAQLQAIYAYNIANSSTPGFVPLRFDEELQKAVKRHDKNFNLENEMAKMSKNRLEHSALVKILSARVQVAKKVFTQGKGG